MPGERGALGACMPGGYAYPGVCACASYSRANYIYHTLGKLDINSSL